jgi:prophage maintenance system killer protein
LVEFLARNGVEWAPPSVEDTVATIKGVAAGRVTERQLAEWLRATLPEG